MRALDGISAAHGENPGHDVYPVCQTFASQRGSRRNLREAATDGKDQLRYTAGEDAKAIIGSRQQLDDATFIGGLGGRNSGFDLAAVKLIAPLLAVTQIFY